MKQYISFFKLKFTTGLQYRTAALAGLTTQFFFGMVYIMVYMAFYGSNNNANTSISLNQIITYIWLGQSFYALISIWHKEPEITNMIKNGDVAYELCRPQNIYIMWYLRILSTKLSSTLLRCFPILILSFFLPYPYNLSLPYSIESLIVFLLIMIVSSLLVTSLITLIYLITFYTIDGKGVQTIYYGIGEILSGQVVPLPLFPQLLGIIASLLPFAYISDFAFRIYCGNIIGSSIIRGFIIEIIWLIIIIILGMKLSNNIIKRVTVQGG